LTVAALDPHYPLSLEIVTRFRDQAYYLASSPDLDGISGRYFIDCRERQPDVAAQNDDTAAQLWKESERLMGL
jgi:hypothetical protein